MILTEWIRRSSSLAHGLPVGALLCALLTLSTVGCGDSSTGPAAVPMALSTIVAGQFAPAAMGVPLEQRGSSIALAPESSASRQVRPVVSAIDSAGNEIKVEGAAMVVGDAELRPTGSDTCRGVEDCARLSQGPLLLRIPLDGSVRSIDGVGQVEAANYEGLHLQLRTARASDAVVVDSFPQLEGASILLEGTYNGTDFTLTVARTEGIRLDFSSAMELADEPSGNVTVQAAATRWFLNDQELLIDPSSQEAGEEIATNMIESLSAYPDLDVDGDPDTGGPIGG